MLDWRSEGWGAIDDPWAMEQPRTGAVRTAETAAPNPRSVKRSEKSESVALAAGGTLAHDRHLSKVRTSSRRRR